MAVRRNRPTIRVRQRPPIWGWDGFGVPPPLQFRAAVAGSAVLGVLLTPFIRIDDSPLFGFVGDLLALGPVAAVGAVLRAFVSALTGRLLVLDSNGLAELVLNSGLSTALGLGAAMVVRPRSQYAYLQVWFFVAGMLLVYSAIIEPGQPVRADGDGRWVSGNSSALDSASRPQATLAPVLADTPTSTAPPSRTPASDLAVTATPAPPLSPTTNPMPTATSTPTSVPTPTLAPTSSPTPRPTATPWSTPTPTVPLKDYWTSTNDLIVHEPETGGVYNTNAGRRLSDGSWECFQPTYRWAAVPGAKTYSSIVYQLRPDGSQGWSYANFSVYAPELSAAWGKCMFPGQYLIKVCASQVGGLLGCGDIYISVVR